jgi:hypothetical protein
LKLTTIYDKQKKYYVMVKLTTDRGTALKKALGVFGHGLSPEAQIAQEQRLQLAGPTTVLVTKRGTATIQVKNIPIVAQPSLKGQKVTINRGTSTRVL